MDLVVQSVEYWVHGPKVQMIIPGSKITTMNTNMNFIAFVTIYYNQVLVSKLKFGNIVAAG